MLLTIKSGQSLLINIDIGICIYIYANFNLCLQVQIDNTIIDVIFGFMYALN